MDTERILYGKSTQENIVAIDVIGDYIYKFIQHPVTGKVYHEVDCDYKPWYLVPSEAHQNLSGNAHFNRIKRMNSFKDMGYLFNTRKTKDESLIISDKSAQYMIESGETLFKGMEFDDVHTLGFDIETTGLDPYQNEVRMISIVDNRGYKKVLYDKNEAKLIEDFIEIIQTVDPSILLTYNGFACEDGTGKAIGFDTRFLITRAEKHGIDFNIGRNKTTPFKYKISFKKDDGTNDRLTMYTCFGRHCIDLMYSVMNYDRTRRELNGYKLKNVISEYGLEKDGRINLTFEEIFEGVDSPVDSKKHKDTIEYCLADSEDLLNLHSHICKAQFYLTQMIPSSYYRVMYGGIISIYNYLMLRSYLDNAESVPMYSEESYTYEGASVEAKAGIFTYVGDSDLTSMYPSIMLHKNIFPRNDSLNIMQVLLEYLRDTRLKLKLDVKKLKKIDGDPVEISSLDGRQNAMKICINGAYGALASFGFYWRDPEQGAEVTRVGRELIGKVKDKILDLGYEITSLDTDGVAYTNGKPIDLDNITEEITKILPKGMYKENETPLESKLYAKMIVFKKKSYAAINDKNYMIIKGSALTSNRIPSFVKVFINRVIRLIFENRIDDIKTYYQGLKSDIINNNLSIEQYAETARISKTVSEYVNRIEDFRKRGIKRSEPLYEAAIRKGIELTTGDKVQVYWGTGYIEKLPTKRQITKSEEMGHMDSLFSPNEIEIKPIKKPVKQLKFIEDYDPKNPDMFVNKYLESIDNKITLLFSVIFDDKTYKYLFGECEYNTSEYDYKDYAYLMDIHGHKQMSKWIRINSEEEKELIYDVVRNNKKDYFTTVTRFKLDENTENETVYMPLYFDIDSKDLDKAYEDAKCIYNYFINVLKVPIDDILVWYSGSKGFHIEVDPRVFNVKPLLSLQRIYKIIAQDLISKYMLESVDIGSIYSSRRMWRLPFSIHSKTGRRKTPLYDFNRYTNIIDIQSYVDNISDYELEVDRYFEYKDRKFTLPSDSKMYRDWYKEYLDKYNDLVKLTVVKKPKWKYDKLEGKLPLCIQFLHRNSIQKNGDRNPATLSLLSFYKESGVDMKTAIDNVLKWSMEIPDDLTSTKSESSLKSNIESVAKTVYNYDRYVFECNYIKFLIQDAGFQCPTSCKLKE